MSTAPIVTIACDIDGVLAPVTLESPTPGCIELPRINHGTQILTRTIAALKGWAYLGASLAWHTTWRAPYADELGELLRLPAMEHFATEGEYLRPEPPATWWKLAAVQRWLRERPTDTHERLVWIDDDITDAVASGEISHELLDDLRVLIISPDYQVGLTNDEITQITEFVRQHQR